MRFGVKTDKGMIREINEDSYNIISGYPGIPVTFVVADGMGGHNSGEIASSMAVDFISKHILQFPELLTKDDISDSIKEIVGLANLNVYNKSLENEENYGMGTTLVIAVTLNKKLFIGHIGDSRAYLFRKGELCKVTTDHSYIEELIKSGSLTRQEAQNHPKKNLITRALGCSDNVETDVYIIDIMEEDKFLLCTDGLTNMLSEEEIISILKASDNPDEVCKKLIDTANEKGGEDNITAVVFGDI